MDLTTSSTCNEIYVKSKWLQLNIHSDVDIQYGPGYLARPKIRIIK